MSLSQSGQPIPFGRYALLDRLNMGGMAEVYLGKSAGIHDTARFVAIKRILPSVADDPEFVRMFIDEAKLSVQLTHANVAQTLELGRIGRSLYIAMEYVSGVDLRQIWEHMQHGGDLPVSALVYIVAKLCEGLDYAHRKVDNEGRPLAIVHRDISPQNIMCAYDGQVKVIDFGIAKAKVRASQTRVGILKGKFAYMSPEQVAGLELDARSDVFSVGIVLYEMLTKSRLFKSESDFMTLERVRHVETFPPSLVSKKVPKELEKIMLKTIARDREERTASAEQLHDMLMRFAIQSGETCSARDLGELLQREFMSEFEAERQRLIAYSEIKVTPSNDVVEEMEMPDAMMKSGHETFAQAVIASGETQIFGMAPAGEDQTRFQATPDAPAQKRPPPVRFVVENTPNLRKPQGRSPQTEGTRLLALAEDPPKQPEATRMLDTRVGEPTQMVEAPSAPEERTDRVRRTGKSPKSSGSKSGSHSQSASRLVEPRFGRESVLVWLSTAVAIVLVMLAYWLSGQLNPSAKLIVDVSPKSAELLVNSKRLGPIAGKGGFEIAPGDVLVEVRAPGHCSWFRHLKLSAKETFSTRVTLQQKPESGPCP
ncbi:MAG: serine/threonine protein kinase [Deltaproteobacteria bacterium]|nr:serine/threonine protein kinase [Deltaproteobacteria bacterium]